MTASSNEMLFNNKFACDAFPIAFLLFPQKSDSRLKDLSLCAYEILLIPFRDSLMPYAHCVHSNSQLPSTHTFFVDTFASTDNNNNKIM